jgi:hypothetical protein
MEALASSLGGAASTLRRGLVLRDGGLAHDPSVLVGLEDMLTRIEDRVASLAADLERQRAALLRAKHTATLAQKQAERIKAVQANLPTHLPGAPNAAASTSATSNTHAQSHANAAPTAAHGPRIAYVRRDELEHLPSSTRGRLTCDQVNEFVDAVQLAFSTKYRLLSQPRTALGEPQMRRVVQFREQECDELQGQFFIVEDDLRTLGNARLDPSGRACLVVLRVLRRLREHRGGGLLRIVALS